MNDPKDQRAVDQAIKRNANVTPTEFRQALTLPALDFVRRVDAQQATQATVSEPRKPQEIKTALSGFAAQPIVLPTQVIPDMQSFPDNSLPQGGWTGSLTVCVESPPGVFTQMTALVQNGLIVSVS